MGDKKRDEEVRRRVDEQVQRNDARIAQRYSGSSVTAARKMATREQYVQSLAARRIRHSA